jgi:hypothetical protein
VRFHTLLASRLPRALLFLGLLSGAARGQDAVRLSLASAEAARARREAATTVGYYNFKAGPTGWRFGSSLEMDFEDNVRLTPDKEADGILRPALTAGMVWPISEKNSLSLNLGAGYSWYLAHSELSHFDLTPGTEVSFDAYAGDVWLNFHDRASALENAYQDPTVAGNGGYSRLENNLGVSALWDLNKVVFRGEYDHVNYIPISNGAGTLNGSSEVFSLSSGYSLGQAAVAGLEVGGSLLTYDSGSPYTGGKQWNAGVFASAPVSEYISVDGHFGYTVFSADGARTNGVPISDVSGMYAQLQLTHRLNRIVTYMLNGGRTISSAFAAASVDLWTAGATTQWHFIEKVPLSAGVTYENGKQADFALEKFARVGAFLSASRSLTEKLSCAARYQYYNRDSDEPGREYDVNIFSLSFTYMF